MTTVDKAERLTVLLKKRGETLSVVESCTGGLLGMTLTEMSGSSEFFLGGIIAYANELKRSLLGVPWELILEHGAVSHQVAEAMARGSLSRTGSDWGLSITGIAGPEGGTPDKPVGTVIIACFGRTSGMVKQYDLAGDRREVREQAVGEALDLAHFVITL